MKIYSYPQNPNLYKVLITAQFSQVELEIVSDFEMGKDNKTAEFLKMNPNGKVPVLQTDEGALWESNAIARYIARKHSHPPLLLGDSAYQCSLVDQWMDWCNHELALPSAVWLYPLLGIIQDNAVATAKAKSDIRKALGILNSQLQGHSFLVCDDHVTLADIVVVCSLYQLYTMVLDPAFREAFANVTEYFTRLVQLPHFQAVLGETHLCQEMKVAPSASSPLLHSGLDADPRTKTASEKRSKAAAAISPNKTACCSSPSAESNQSQFDIRKWKELYFGAEDVQKQAIPHFWDMFDPSHWSIWWCEYKFNDDLEKLIMTQNVINGFAHQLHDMSEHLFGVLLVFGDEPHLEIAGCFLIRGHHVLERMSRLDLIWKRANTEDASEKQLVEEYLSCSGTFNGRKYSGQFKVFK